MSISDYNGLEGEKTPGGKANLEASIETPGRVVGLEPGQCPWAPSVGRDCGGRMDRAMM